MMGTYANAYRFNSPVVNVYDWNLARLAQVVLPSSLFQAKGIINSYNINGDKLKIVSTTCLGPRKINALYTIYNFKAGKLDQMEYLEKKKVDRDDFVGSVMWFKDKYIVPYFSPKGIMNQSKFELSLAQNTYN